MSNIFGSWNIFKRLRELEAKVEVLESQTTPVLIAVAERRAKKAEYAKQYYAKNKRKGSHEQSTHTDN